MLVAFENRRDSRTNFLSTLKLQKNVGRVEAKENSPLVLPIDICIFILFEVLQDIDDLGESFSFSARVKRQRHCAFVVLSVY